MKKNKNMKGGAILLTSVLLLITFLIACQKEDVIVETDLIETSDLVVKNGRFSFTSTIALNAVITSFKSMEEKEVGKKLAPIYEKGFTSMRPIFRSEKDPNIEQYVERMRLVQTQKSVSGEIDYSLEEELDDLEELIGDDEFASFINNEGEIQIADTIYKYTHEGLYFVHEKDIDYLYNYLNEEEIDGIAIQKLIPMDEDPCLNSGLQPIDDIITKYTVPCDNDYDDPSDPSDPPTIPPTTNELADQFASSLTACDHSSTWISGVFGKTAVCRDKFSDQEYRVKTKFWDQNYLIYKSIGVIVKSQKFGWFWWNRTESDEIQLRINTVYFEFSYPNPTLSNTPDITFTYDDIVYDRYGGIIGPAVNESPLELPFNTDLILNLNLPKAGINDDVDYSKIEKILLEFGFDAAKKFIKDRNITPNDLTVVGLAPLTSIIYKTNEFFKELNTKQIKKRYDEQAGITVGIYGGKVKFSAYKEDFYKYKNIRVDVIGMARRNNEWRGNRLTFTGK